jgi:quercetin dioxygenase-like cupin family protein
MLRIASSIATFANTQLLDNPTRKKSDYFVPKNDDEPQAYMLEHEAGNIIHPHFHTVDQFQLFVAGSGRVGREEVQAVSVHYTDRYSPYGPIVAGYRGLTFVTLRRQKDAGAHYMPASRGKMVQRAGRNLTHHYEVDDVARMRAGAACDITILEAVHEDGLALRVLRAGPGAHVALEAAVAHGDQYLYVLAGSVEVESGADLPVLSCAYRTRQSPAISFRAGISGVELLVLVFPTTSASNA